MTERRMIRSSDEIKVGVAEEPKVDVNIMANDEIKAALVEDPKVTAKTSSSDEIKVGIRDHMVSLWQVTVTAVAGIASLASMLGRRKRDKTMRDPETVRARYHAIRHQHRSDTAAVNAVASEFKISPGTVWNYL